MVRGVGGGVGGPLVYVEVGYGNRVFVCVCVCVCVSYEQWGTEKNEIQERSSIMHFYEVTCGCNADYSGYWATFNYNVI